jgi:putative transposase
MIYGMEIWHILNRGVDKRDVVKDEADRIRFVHDLFMFNDRNAVNPNHRFKGYDSSNRKHLVAIHAWCLMPNHYHLLVSELVEGGMSLFMRKLNMGYAKYFNERYERSGYLWQGVFRKKLIARDAHFIWIPYYIHLNPLDLSFKKWREGKVSDSDKAIENLRKYRWSSYLDYMGEKNFPSLINKELLQDVLGSVARQEKEVRSVITGNNSALGRLGSVLE